MLTNSKTRRREYRSATLEVIQIRAPVHYLPASMLAGNPTWTGRASGLEMAWITASPAIVTAAGSMPYYVGYGPQTEGYPLQVGDKVSLVSAGDAERASVVRIVRRRLQA